MEVGTKERKTHHQTPHHTTPQHDDAKKLASHHTRGCVRTAVPGIRYLVNGVCGPRGLHVLTMGSVLGPVYHVTDTVQGMYHTYVQQSCLDGAAACRCSCSFSVPGTGYGTAVAAAG